MLEVTWVSVRVATGACALILLPGIAVGWALSRPRLRARALWQSLVTLPMVLPPVAVGLVLLWLLRADAPLGRLAQALTGGSLLLTESAAMLAAAVVAFPLLVLGAQRGFSEVPERLEQVSRSLGASRWQTFRRITLPLAGRGIGHGLVFAFARALGEFGATILVAGRISGRTETLSTAMYGAIEGFRDAEAWRLAAVAAALAFGATLMAELWLGRGRSRSAGRAS